MPLAIIVALAVVLAALAVLSGKGSEPDDAAPLLPDPVARIIDRVEAERGLRFRSDPQPREVTSAQARREAMAALEADYPRARRRADADALGCSGSSRPAPTSVRS